MRKDSWKVLFDGQGFSSEEIFKKIMGNRGVPEDAIEEVLSPRQEWIFPSTAFKNIEKAARTFIDAINSGKRFLIFADVDADGCTSAAIIHRYLRNFDVLAKTYINKGKAHGIQNDFDYSLLEDVDIVIIVDSLNSTTDAYERILNMGKEIIVLDHHVPTEEILGIQENINLVSSANEYPNPHLSGSGVCWKFVRYIDSILGIKCAEELVDLASVGLIADVSNVGITAMENRAICNMGFDFIINPALRVLLNKDTMNSMDIGYGVAPLINASNRMNDNEPALRLFLSDDKNEIKDIIQRLTDSRAAQKELVAKLLTEVETQYEAQKDNNFYIFFVWDCENLSGLLATQAVSKYSKPCIVIKGEDENTISGSMRSVGTDDFRALVNASGIAECSGHENSAGITINKETYWDFVDYINNALKDIVFEDKFVVDVRIHKAQVTPFLTGYVDRINRICGEGFEKCITLIEDVKDYDVTQLSKGKHLCVKTKNLQFLHWNFNKWPQVIKNGRFSAIGVIGENEFAGRKNMQMIVEDFVFADNDVTQLW